METMTIIGTVQGLTPARIASPTGCVDRGRGGVDAFAPTVTDAAFPALRVEV